MRKVRYKRYIGGCCHGDGYEEGFGGDAFFHRWTDVKGKIYTKNHIEDCMVTVAILELADGKIIEVQPNFIIFLK